MVIKTGQWRVYYSQTLKGVNVELNSKQDIALRPRLSRIRALLVRVLGTLPPQLRCVDCLSWLHLVEKDG